MLKPNQRLGNGRYVVLAVGEAVSDSRNRAIDNEQVESVYIKRLKDNASDDLPNVSPVRISSRLKEMATRCAAVKSPSLLPVLEQFHDDDSWFLVSEYIELESLTQIVKTGKDLRLFGDLRKWSGQLLDLMANLQGVQPPIAGCRLQPDRVYVSPEGNICLLSADIVEAWAMRESLITSNAELEAESLPYMSFEEIWDKLDAASKKVISAGFYGGLEKSVERPPDAASEVYSLAATLYFLVTGNTPVDALTRITDVMDGKPDPLVAPHQAANAVEPEYSDVLMKAMAISRSERVVSALLLRQMLRTADVRVKERLANPSVENVPSSSVVTTAKASAAHLKFPAIAPKTAESSLVRDKQLDFVEQQLRLAEMKRQEAESQRLEAERRAAEAERLLTETIHRSEQTANKVSDEEMSAAYVPLTNEVATPQSIPTSPVLHTSFTPERTNETAFHTAPNDFPNAPQRLHQSHSSDRDIDKTTFVIAESGKTEPNVNSDTFVEKDSLEFDDKPSKNQAKLFAFAGGLVILLVAGIGFWLFGSNASTANDNPSVSTQNTVNEKNIEKNDAALSPAPSTTDSTNTGAIVTTTPETKPAIAEQKSDEKPPVNTENVLNGVADGKRSPRSKPTPPLVSNTPPPPPVRQPRQPRIQSADNKPRKKDVTLDDLISN